MKDFDVNQLLQLFAQYEFELKIGGMIVIAVLLLWLVVSLLLKVMARSGVVDKTPESKQAQTPRQPARQEPAPAKPAVAAKEIPEDSPKPKAVETPSQPVKQAAVVAAVIPKASPKPAAAKAAAHQIPQDSVLRRHYVSHVRYMIETVSMPRPTEIVLRRHYEQLIASQLDDCLNDGAKMEKLIQRYDQHRRNAVIPLAA